MTFEVRDRLDVAGLVIAIPFGVMITLFVQNHIDAILLAERERRVIGGETFLYGLILGGSIFILFQISQLILHWLYHETDDQL